MNIPKVASLLMLLPLWAVTAFGQIDQCAVKIVPDELSNDKVTVNLSDLCSNCGPYGGNNGTINNPPNGATGCAIIKFTEEILLDCVVVGIDPQATEKTDYYFNPLVATEDCFTPDGTTSSQGEIFNILVDDLVLVDGFYDVLVCSQSTGNRSYEVTIVCCPSAGTPSDTEVCETNSVPIDLFSLIDGEDSGGSWTRLSGSGGLFDPDNGTFTSAVGATTSEFQYAAPDNPNTSECNLISTVTVTITPAPNAGDNNTITLCSDGNSINLFDLLGMDAEASGLWSGPSTLANGFQGTFDPQSNLEGTYAYTVVGTGSCDNDISEVIVSIENAPSAGTNGTLSFCSNQAPPMTLISGLGGMPDSGGSWSPSTDTPGTFNPSIDTPGEYTYTVTGNTPCSNSSAIVMVFVASTPNPGEDGTATLCSDGNPVNLEDYLNGTPDGGGTWSPTLKSGTSVFDPSEDAAGDYTYSFDIQDCTTSSAVVSVIINTPPTSGTDTNVDICSSGDPVNLYDYIGDPGQGGVWTGPSMLDNGYQGNFDPSDDSGGEYLYTINAQDPCSDAITTVMVNIFEPLNAGKDTSIVMCISNNGIDLFTLLGEDVDKGGTWTPELNSGTDMFIPAYDGSGSFTYTLAATAECKEQSATVSTTVVKGNTAGQSSYILVFTNDPPFDLFETLTMDPDVGGFWNPAPLSGTGIFDPANDKAGVYTYHVEALGPCEADFANVTVELLEHQPIPTMGTWGIIILCLIMIIVGKISIPNIQLQKF